MDTEKIKKGLAGDTNLTTLGISVQWHAENAVYRELCSSSRTIDLPTAGYEGLGDIIPFKSIHPLPGKPSSWKSFVYDRFIVM